MTASEMIGELRQKRAFKKGIEQGLEQGLELTIRKLLSKGFAAEETATLLEVELEKVLASQEELKKGDSPSGS